MAVICSNELFIMIEYSGAIPTAMEKIAKVMSIGSQSLSLFLK